VTCWGTTAALDRLGPAPPGPFVDIAVSARLDDDAVCARTASGNAVCWGYAPPSLPGSYADLGDEIGCVLTATGDAHCPAIGDTAALDWSGPFEQVGGSAIEVCGLKPDDTIVCSGTTPVPGPAEVDLHGGYVAILVSNEDGVCGLHEDAWLSCPTGPELPYPFQQVDGLAPWRGNIGPYCALILDGYPLCWGAGGVTPHVPAGPFERIHVSASGTVFCGFHLDRTVSCWINPNNGWESAAAMVP
jgi:hypothetical protein